MVSLESGGNKSGVRSLEGISPKDIVETQYFASDLVKTRVIDSYFRSKNSPGEQPTSA